MADLGELQDLPLPALFARGRAVLQQLEGAPASAPATQQAVAAGAAVFRQAAAAADALALFSPNEDRDDLATADIKYLLIPFYQAEVATHMHADDPAVRLAALAAAARHYCAFLLRCRQYGLLSPPAEAAADVALKQAGQGGGGVSPPVDAATLRHNKIESFKRDKWLKGRLEALERQLGAGGGGAEGEDERGDGEEVERELWMLQADRVALQTAERLGSLRQEAKILRHAAAMPPEERQRQQEERQQRGPPADLLRQLQSTATGLSVGAAQRNQLVAGVFRPGYTLPTMSVEQFGELEYRRMLEQQAAEAKAKERQQRAQAAKSAEQVEEEELHKAREWDDFKDANPRGWGNSKLRPCG